MKRLFFISFVGLWGLSGSGLAWAKTTQVENTPGKAPLLRPVPLNPSLIKKIKRQGGALMSEKLGDYLRRAENLVANKKYDTAIELLTYHYNREGLTKTEKATLALNIAFIYRQKDSSTASLAWFQKALDNPGLDYNQYLLALYNQAQIHIEEGRLKKGVALLKQWFSLNPRPHPSSYILLAHTYYLKQQLPLALQYVEQSLSLVAEPKESWLSFPVAIHIKQKNYKKARPYLEQLVALYPSRAAHWKQLAGVYMYLNQSKKALITLDMANKMGHLKTESEWGNLAVLYIDQGQPYQSAQLLEKKIKEGRVPKDLKNLELLAEAFYLARERSLSLDYLKIAGQKASDYKFFVKYGQRLLSEEKWTEAESAFKQALASKDMTQTLQNIEDYKIRLAKQDSQGEGQGIPQQIAERKIASVDARFRGHDGGIGHDKAGENDGRPNTKYLENIYLNVGVSLYYQEKYSKALENFRKSIEVNDTFIPGYQWIEYTENRLSEQKQVAL